MPSNNRNTRENRIWRAGVIRRDGHCVICGSIKNRQAHHIEDYSYHPEKRYLLNNGVTLCGTNKETGVKGCHVIFHTSFKRSYRQKCTIEDWEQFCELMERVKPKKIIYES